MRCIAVGEVSRRLFLKCIAKKTELESAELISFKQPGVWVKGGAESTMKATKITFEKLEHSQNVGILQIVFKHAFNSHKRR